jgi:HAMP domain-containing protein
VVRAVVPSMAAAAAIIRPVAMMLAVVLVMVVAVVLLMVTGRIIGPVARLADAHSADRERSCRPHEGDKA